MAAIRVIPIILVSVLVVSMAAVAQDDIDLHIDPDDVDGYYRLYWTGGAAPCEVYRSTDPAIVVLAANRLGETILQVWLDEPPTAAGLWFYQVTSSCSPACEMGEICCYELCCSLPNATPACGGAGLGCIVESCDENYWNRNGINSDGCEFFCDTPLLSDFPDLLGDDENCDLVDGEVNNAVFVAKWGDDGYDGSLGYPKLTIQAGIDAAVAGGMRDVYVAAGFYFEEVSIPAGVGVYGGYDDDFYARDIDLHETIISGTDSTPPLPGAVNFLSVSGQPAGSTVLDGFTVFAPDSPSTSWPSYGVYLRDSDESVHITNNSLYGGDGGDGADGETGMDGTFGAAGSPGLDALDLYEAYGVADHDCTAVNYSPGGFGGTMDCDGASTSGGAGGERVCPVWDDLNQETIAPVASETGQTGLNGGGIGGGAGWDAYQASGGCNGETWGSVLGNDGEEGNTGGDGPSGQGCSSGSGTVVGSLWVADSSTAGSDGGHGAGGGGGGSGAGAWVTGACADFGFDNLGGSGGGGGAGGCGGTGGLAGEGGGGSFALFVTYSLPASTVSEITANTIHTGFGGNGGDGGGGGYGGAGGGVGAGGIADATYVDEDWAYPSFPGGDGGSGGRGGYGGGAGGACGGPAYGIFAWNTGAVDLQSWNTGNTILTSGSGGSGGRGGSSYGDPGTDGSDGTHGATNF